jgi:outer membrane protein assembly factor BamB
MTFRLFVSAPERRTSLGLGLSQLRRALLAPILLIAAWTLVNPIARADDWPQWMGPKRDNVWRESGIIEKFPDGGPAIVWRTPIAGGYAGPAVSGGFVWVTDYSSESDVKVENFERKEFTGQERVLCLDAATGKVLWKHEYPVEYEIAYPAGPRCTPVVHEGKVYTLGAEGHLIALAADTGKVIWEKDLKSTYSTKAALWGYAAHPLIDGKKLITLAGGEGSHIVAYDKDTGAEIWRSTTSKEQGYSPPTIFEAGGTKQLVLLRPDAVSSIHPDTGKEHWSVPYEATNGSIIMSPILWKNHIYGAGFSNQNILIALGKDAPTAKVEWANLKKAAVSPVNVQPFLDGDVIYGFDQDGTMHAVELPSGKRLWSTSAPLGPRPVATGTAFIIREARAGADGKEAGRFWLFTETGDLVIAKLSPKGYEELDRAHVIEPTNVAFGRKVVWCAPAWANRRVYVRNDSEIICVDLAAKDSPR